MTVLVGRLIEEARGAGVPTRIEAEAEAAVRYDARSGVPRLRNTTALHIPPHSCNKP